MTEPTQDENRRRMEQLLAAKKAAGKAAGGTNAGNRGGAQHLPDAKSGKSFKRRKV
jgi:hypothetical protein